MAKEIETSNRENFLVCASQGMLRDVSPSVYNMYCIMYVPKAMYVPEIHPGANRANITQPHMCLVNTIPDIFPLLHLNSLARSPSREP